MVDSSPNSSVLLRSPSCSRVICGCIYDVSVRTSSQDILCPQSWQCSAIPRTILQLLSSKLSQIARNEGHKFREKSKTWSQTRIEPVIQSVCHDSLHITILYHFSCSSFVCYLSNPNFFTSFVHICFILMTTQLQNIHYIPNL